ncbi:hypothetical protein BRADI_1g14101v3 [Brachypodium distachyon]|uniref:Uncharacterized protein n=1 Tax=Brachypodium distachyon TaxID=15368 RepID=A0A0Q3JQ27_BRADI|nr:hypothetical protein BRADI_1g14101v3 [Brachypodium distachyon]
MPPRPNPEPTKALTPSPSLVSPIYSAPPPLPLSWSAAALPVSSGTDALLISPGPPAPITCRICRRHPHSRIRRCLPDLAGSVYAYPLELQLLQDHVALPLSSMTMSLRSGRRHRSISSPLHSSSSAPRHIDLPGRAALPNLARSAAEFWSLAPPMTPSPSLSALRSSWSSVAIPISGVIASPKNLREF